MEPLTVMFEHNRTIEKFQGIGPAEALAIWSSGLSVWHIWCWTTDAIQEIADIYDPLLCPDGDSSAIWAWVVGLDPFEGVCFVSSRGKMRVQPRMDQTQRAHRVLRARRAHEKGVGT